MKTWGSWAKVVASIGAVALIGSLLMVMATRHSGKNSLQRRGAALTAVTSGTARLTQTRENPKWLEAYGKLPLSFEENQGQTARDVRYVSHGSGYELFLTPQEAVLSLWPKLAHDLSPLHRTAALRKERRTEQITAIRMRLEGANPDAKIAGMGRLPGKTNYFIGNDPKKWHTDVPSYARVRYSGIYPGVDLVFYGNQRQLEYDFVVAPGADPKAIALNVQGGRKMRINAHGDLVLSVSGGEVELQKPVVYQNVKGERREIAGEYVIDRNRRVTFAVGYYDRGEPLILDPVLNYSTYLGGSASDGGFAIAVDAAGDAFVAGQTMSTDFPAGAKVGIGTVTTPLKAASFVAELDPTGTKLLYSTYLGGNNVTSGQFEQAFGIALDTSGKVYVAGLTYAANFPTTSNALKSGANPGNVNGTSYITKLDPTLSGMSSLLYSSYLGGTNGTAVLGGDVGQAVAVDSSNPANGIVYVAGYTDSTPGSSIQNFPVMNGFQATLNCSNGNAFLAKIDTTKSAGASLLYSTYLGGTCANALVAGGLGYGEDAFGVAVGATGNAYLAGATSSTDFPTFGNAYQPNAPAGNTLGTAFVTQIDTTQTGAASKIYSTYLGGMTSDQAFAIALGPGNVAYVTGTTSSSNFPITPKPGAFDTNGAPTGKAFVSLIDTTLAAVPSLKYSTFLGGTGGDTGFGIRADAQGNAYVAGTTSSSVDFPFPPKAMIMGGFEPTYPPGAKSVGFISKLNPGGNSTADLLYSTYFGGSGSSSGADHLFAIAIDTSNPANAYVTGQTFSTAATFPVFPTAAPTAFQTMLNGTSDAFVAKLTPIATLAVAPTSLNFGTILIPNTSPAKTVTLTNNTNAAIAFTSAVVNGSPAAANTDYMVTNSCSGSIPFGATNTCTVSVTFKPTVAGAETATLQLTDSDSTSPQNIALSGTGTNSAPGVGFAPTSLSFGGQMLTTTSAAKTVTLTNTGTGPLTINSIADPSDFAQTNNCPVSPQTLAAGANCTINVTFAPTAVGARSGTLTVTDNASGNPHTVPLTGTGWDFGVAAPASLTVKDGQTGNFNVTVTPLGGFNQAVTVACAGAPALATCTPTTPVTPADGVTAVTSAVTVTTKVSMLPPPTLPTPPTPLSIRQIVPLLLALSLFVCLFMTRRLRVRLGMVTAVVILLALAGCGSSGPSTPKGTTNLTITCTSNGTAGTVSHTATVALTVN